MRDEKFGSDHEDRVTGHEESQGGFTEGTDTGAPGLRTHRRKSWGHISRWCQPKSWSEPAQVSLSCQQLDPKLSLWDWERSESPTLYDFVW